MINNFKKIGLIVVLLFLAVGLSGCKKSDNAKVDNSSSNEQVAEEVGVSEDNSNEKKEEREYFAIARDIEKRFGIDDGFYAKLLGGDVSSVLDYRKRYNSGEFIDIKERVIENLELDIVYNSNGTLSIDNWQTIKNEKLGFEIKFPKGLAVDSEPFDEHSIIFYVEEIPIVAISDKTYKDINDFILDDPRDKQIYRKEGFVGNLNFENKEYNVIGITVDMFTFIYLGKETTFLIDNKFFDVNGIDPQVFYEILKSYKEI